MDNKILNAQQRLNRIQEAIGTENCEIDNRYSSYLKSRYWQRKRLLMLERAEYRCERCGAENVKLEVHHLNYNSVGDETTQDLQVLCSVCHNRLFGKNNESNEIDKQKIRDVKKLAIRILKSL